MKLKLKEEPKEWRKAALMSMMGLAVLSSVLRWRRVLPVTAWLLILSLLAVIAIAATIQPGWFRGYYRFTTRLGFSLSQLAGKLVLFFFFCLVITPVGLFMRLLGKDPLRLRRPAQTDSYWSEVRRKSPLDRLF